MTDENRAWAWRVHERAKAVLKPGDKLRVGRCGGSVITVRFIGWEGFWACSPTLNDLAPTAIVKVNGEPVDFANGEPRPA